MAAPAPPEGAGRLRLANGGASTAALFVACACYALGPQNRDQLGHLFHVGGFFFTGQAFLIAAAVVYGAAMNLWFLLVPTAETSKSLRVARFLWQLLRDPTSVSFPLPAKVRVALLATLLKGFFGPLMVMSLMVFCVSAIENGTALAQQGFAGNLRLLFDQHGFWFLMQVILFADVLIFTIGYLVETPALGNEIRSVDATLLGWGAALLCYPPFNKLTGAILGSPVSDFPQFESPTAHLVLNFTLLALMAVYASASVALGFKASNLTHRGIVHRGPYRVIRHPAYVCKNLAWWIGSIPLVELSFRQSTLAGAQAIASVAGWTLLYVLRALTEEDHLRRVDGEYAEYAKRVPWRFIPGVH